jgi:membrane protease YdiL (CAAX protease family)
MIVMPVDKSATCGTGSPLAAGRERRDLLELSIGYGLILLAIWTPQPWQRLFYWGALAWVLLVTWVSFDGWIAMGLRISEFTRSLWVVGVALLLAAVAFAIAAKLHTLHSPGYPTMFVKRYWAYTIWAFLQQFLLLDFVLLRLLRLLPNRKSAVIVAAVLFAFAHLPNPILTPATLIWGFAACMLFLQYRNVYTLAMVHAIFGICMAVTIPGPVDHNMRVGLSYLMYRPHDHHHRSQKDHTVSTQAWVIADAPTRRS